MLKKIVKRALFLGAPAGAMYLLFFYGCVDQRKPSFALGALLFPLFTILFEADKIWKKRKRENDREDARNAEVIVWSVCIGICALLFAIGFPIERWHAFGTLIAVPLLIARLVKLGKRL